MPKATRKNTTSKKSSLSPDPVFAAIENHQKLDRAWLDLAIEADSALGNPDVDRGCSAAWNAAWDMARTKPTTAAGAVALLTYII
jgi:hypothetical protein